MNITTHTANIPVPTVTNPPTEALRRDNVQREIITQPAAAQQSAREKGAASERERARTPAQNNEQIDFEQLRKQAEKESSTITEDGKGDSENQGDSSQQDSSQQGNQASKNNPDNQQASSDDGADNASEPDFADQQLIRELQNRDKEVRSHEQAHATAGGAYTGAPSYSFEVGPDGKKYAVEGEVSVDLSPIKGDPQATIAKLQKVYNAALAPANPSIQDSRVANKAAQLIAQAQSELYEITQSAINATSGERVVIDTSDRFASNNAEEVSGNDFDQRIQQTLNAQEEIAPFRPAKVEKAAVVIESLYSNVHSAYEKPSRSQFELTA
ncbi:putative metalloprotease CJM1_0395 family protein [Thalassotalea sp. 1_MG-2023]|uniref:putative metalloprotease CJM1_0395 family protein n=1 Tax=Thalassotalea sp. 1_MG-2023 TaxID=3062680 RepID=UPI0026E46514|nr:putative metalloprotease CJM1_0395 family protein [Thalassotalea sp. 1_MG-2023]MDO6425450.1 putative metalloprotease CJM1_0395 family protein [Thalassotalea sp. 1_MG-2023]